MQGFIKIIKSARKVIYNVTKIYISNKCSSFELSIHLWILENKIDHGFHKNMKQHNGFQLW